MIAYILTGGEGTRVKEITDRYNCEKHQIPINGRPFNKYMVDWLRKQPIIDGIKYLDQPRVGTGGAIKLLTSRLSVSLHTRLWKLHEVRTPFLLIYGDCYSPINVTDLYESFLSDDSDMTIVTRLVDDPDYGLIEAFGWREIDDLVRRYVRHHDTEPPYMTNIGTYMIGRRSYEYIRNQPWRDEGEGVGVTLSLEHHIFNPMLRVLNVYTYGCSDLPYYDVGTPERIKETEAMLSAST